MIRLSGNQGKEERGNPDTPIPRYPDTPFLRFPDSKRAGFTLIELILVIAVIGVLAAIVLPRYGRGVLTKLDLYSTTHRVCADLRLTRRLAITKGSVPNGYYLQFSGGFTSYGIYDEATNTLVDPPGIQTIPDETTCSGDGTFTFKPLGNAETNYNLSLSSGEYQYNLGIIVSTGRISLY